MIDYLPLVITGLGLTASIIYYASVLRNANKTRQTQLYMQLMNKDTSQEFQGLRFDISQININDFEDLRKKIDTDRELSVKFTSFMFHNDNVGYLLEAGLVDPEMIYKFGAGGRGPIRDWETWSPYINYIRKTRDVPDYLNGFEYYANKMREIRENKGYSTNINNTST